LQVITGAIIELGSNLGIEVLAEGIESQAEFDHLARTSCNHGQGFLIGHPVPLEELQSWIRDWKRRHGIGTKWNVA
jgi:EAL domain-containing protein (putative c-di-GMP-specific phosphodiesterase class I)